MIKLKTPYFSFRQTMKHFFAYRLIAITTIFVAGLLIRVNTTGAQVSGTIVIGGGAGGYASEPWLRNPFNLPEAPVIEIVAAVTYWLLAILGFFGVIGFHGTILPSLRRRREAIAWRLCRL